MRLLYCLYCALLNRRFSSLPMPRGKRRSILKSSLGRRRVGKKEREQLTIQATRIIEGTRGCAVPALCSDLLGVLCRVLLRILGNY